MTSGPKTTHILKPAMGKNWSCRERKIRDVSWTKEQSFLSFHNISTFFLWNFQRGQSYETNCLEAVSCHGVVAQSRLEVDRGWGLGRSCGTEAEHTHRNQEVMVSNPTVGMFFPPSIFSYFLSPVKCPWSCLSKRCISNSVLCKQ